MVRHPHLQYAEDVCGGSVVAGDHVKRTCELTLWRHEENEPEWEYRPEYANPVIAFVETCPHVKGEWAARGETLRLEPWLKFFISEVWGWRGRDDPALRRYLQAYLEVGRKNSKTTVGAALELYETQYGDYGAEVYSASTIEDQALISWNTARKMIRRLPEEMAGALEIKGGQIIDTTDESYFEALTGKPRDGLNPSFVLFDEAAVSRDREQIEVLTSGLGSRQGACVLFITTASKYLHTAWRDKRAGYISALRAGFLPDRVFGLLYCIDEGDDPADEACWPKANPNLGISKFLHFMRAEAEEAKLSPRKWPDFLRKQLNVYHGAAATWLQPERWLACEVGKILREGKCFVGADASATGDLFAVCRVWDRESGQLDVDFKCWAAQAAVDNLADEAAQAAFAQAIDEGKLEVVDGEVLDFELVAEYLRETAQTYDVQHIGSDPFKAQSMFNELAAEGLPVLRVPYTMPHIAPATAEAERLIKQKILRAEQDEFIRWQFGNCFTRQDKRENYMLCKGENTDLKIDAFAALTLALRGRAAGDTPPEFNFYVVGFGNDEVRSAEDFGVEAEAAPVG